MTKDELIVGVSGINAVDNPGPGVGIARALKDDTDLNIKIVGLAYDAMEPGIYLDWLIDKTYVLPYPSVNKAVFIERLAYIKQTYGLDFIFPNLDAELPIYTTYADEIEQLGIKLFLPDQEQFRLRGKDRLTDVAQTIKIEIPQTRVVNTPTELIEATEELGFPVMVKGALYKAYRTYSKDEAIKVFHKIAAEWGYPIIVQQVVRGEEMNVVGVGDGNGGLIGQVGIKKMWVTELGKIWTGVTIKNAHMLIAARKFVQEYRWKGPFEMECMVDGDKVYLLEINPRFPAWSYFTTGIGMNLPANTLRKAFDLPLTISDDYEAGKLYIRYTYETITDMLTFQRIITQGEN